MMARKIVRNKVLITLVTVLFFTSLVAQTDRWQQRISYKIDATLNVNNNRVNGTQQVVYYNNSPDTLSRVFFFTYWNAFKPNSSMDVRSRELGKTILGTDKDGKEIRDWDARVKDRI